MEKIKFLTVQKMDVYLSPYSKWDWDASCPVHIFLTNDISVTYTHNPLMENFTCSRQKMKTFVKIKTKLFFFSKATKLMKMLPSAQKLALFPNQSFPKNLNLLTKFKYPLSNQQQNASILLLTTQINIPKIIFKWRLNLLWSKCFYWKPFHVDLNKQLGENFSQKNLFIILYEQGDVRLTHWTHTTRKHTHTTK